MELPSRPAVRAAAVVLVAAAMSAVASPAFATVRDDGDQPGDTMGWSTAILLFVGIPATFAAFVWLLASAPGWTRAGRAPGSDAEDPLMLGSAATGSTATTTSALGSGDASVSALDSGERDPAGGTSARW